MRALLRRSWPRLAAAVLLQVLALPARAGVGVSLAVNSDFVLRGVSLSNGRPTLSLNLSYDHDSGLYAGGSVTAVQTEESGVQALGYIANVGFAHRLTSNVSWEVGATTNNVSIYVYRRFPYDYTEVYAGINASNVSAHVYVSPDYLNQGVSTIYADVDGAYRPARHWRLFAHAGVLNGLGERRWIYAHRTSFDLRLGVAREFDNLELSLAWTPLKPALTGPARYALSPSTIVFGASFFF